MEVQAALGNEKDSVIQKLRGKWDEELSKLDVSVRASLDANAFADFVADEYDNVQKELAAEGRTKRVPAPISFVPKVDVSEGDLEEIVIEKRRGMLREMDAETEKRLEQELLAMWNVKRAETTDVTRRRISVAPSRVFFAEHYYDVMEKLLSQHRRALVSPSNSWQM